MGVAVFVAGVALIVGIVHVLSRHDVPPTACASGTADAAGAGRVAFVLACLAAALIQLLPAPTPATGIGDAAFPGWPATFEERALRQTPLTPQEAAFNTAFPGRIARFEDGSRVLIWRWVTRPTHRVHAATDCLRSSGWRITPLPLRGDTGGPWSCFLAERRGVRLQVRERCTAPDGRTWPDVPAWFWAAWLGRSTGPWQVITVAERAYGTMP
jgi:hypothetical protein